MDNDLMVIIYLIPCFIAIYLAQGIFYCSEMLSTSKYRTWNLLITLVRRRSMMKLFKKHYTSLLVMAVVAFSLTIVFSQQSSAVTTAERDKLAGSYVSG